MTSSFLPSPGCKLVSTQIFVFIAIWNNFLFPNVFQHTVPCVYYPFAFWYLVQQMVQMNWHIQYLLNPMLLWIAVLRLMQLLYYCELSALCPCLCCLIYLVLPEWVHSGSWWWRILQLWELALPKDRNSC